MGIEIIIIASVVGGLGLLASGTSLGTFIYFKKKSEHSSDTSNQVIYDSKLIDEKEPDGSTKQTRHETVTYKYINHDEGKENTSVTRTGLPNKVAENLSANAGTIGGFLNDENPLTSLRLISNIGGKVIDAGGKIIAAKIANDSDTETESSAEEYSEASSTHVKVHKSKHGGRHYKHKKKYHKYSRDREDDDISTKHAKHKHKHKYKKHDDKKDESNIREKDVISVITESEQDSDYILKKGYVVKFYPMNAIEASNLEDYRRKSESDISIKQNAEGYKIKDHYRRKSTDEYKNNILNYEKEKLGFSSKIDDGYGESNSEEYDSSDESIGYEHQGEGFESVLLG